MNQQVIDALQRIHELTQQNAPESAGAAWAAFIEEILIVARHPNTIPNVDMNTIVYAGIKRCDMDTPEIWP